MQGHAEAFAVLGGIPVRHILYDNLKPAVKQVCFGRSRVESQRWVAFRSHYGFDAFYFVSAVCQVDPAWTAIAQDYGRCWSCMVRILVCGFAWCQRRSWAQD